MNGLIRARLVGNSIAAMYYRSADGWVQDKRDATCFSADQIDSIVAALPELPGDLSGYTIETVIAPDSMEPVFFENRISQRRVSVSSTSVAGFRKADRRKS